MKKVKELFIILTKYEHDYYKEIVDGFCKFKSDEDLYVFGTQVLVVFAMDDADKEINNNWPIKQQEWIASKIDEIRKKITPVNDDKIYLILHDKDVLGGKLFNGRLDFSRDGNNPLNKYKNIYAFSHPALMGTYLLNAPVDENYLTNLKNKFFNE